MSEQKGGENEKEAAGVRTSITLTLLDGNRILYPLPIIEGRKSIHW